MTAFEIWRNASNGRVVIRKTDDDGCITGAEKIYPNGLLVITEEQREAIEGRAVSPSLNMFTNGTLTLVSTGGSGGGASVHNDLSGRTAADAHPQAAVTGLVADLAGKVPVAQPINAQTGATYTLVAGDAGKLVTLDNAGAVSLTVPQDSDATIPVGTYVDVMQLGAGQVTVVAGSGATLRVSGLTAKARAQYARFGVQKVSADTWSLYGDLAAS